MRKNKFRLPFTIYRLPKNPFLLSTLYSLLSTILLFTVLSGCVRREIKNIGSKGKKIICFGDSITFGYGAGPGEDYPAALAKLVSLPVMNKGIDGDTSVEAIKRLATDVLDRDPLLVIIEFGGNDFLRKIPKETTLNNITEMIDRVQAKGAMAAVIDVSAGMFLKDYRWALKRLSARKGAIFIPAILSGVITNPAMKSDFFHPNSQGYKMIADKVYLAIKPYVEQPAKPGKSVARK